MTRRDWQTLIALMLAECAGSMGISGILAGLAAWLRIYGDPVGVGWIMSAYLLVSAAAAALCGRLGDIYGRKLVLAIVIAVTAVGSGISALASNLDWIVAGRAIQGLSGAILPLCYGLVREHLPRHRIPFGVSMIVGTASVGSAIALLVAGILTDRVGPQSIFVALGLYCCIATVTTLVMIPSRSSAPPSGPIDWLGGILFAPGVAALLLVASNGNRWGWLSSTSMTVSAVGIGLIAVWAIHEARQKEPLIDVKLLANRNCAFGNLIMICAAAGVMQLTQLTSMLLQQPTWTSVGLGTSATTVGILKFPALLAGLVSSLWAGWISTIRGSRFPLLIGCAAMAVTAAFAALDHGSVAIIIAILCTGLMGVTAVYTAIPIVIMAGSPEDRTSESTGLMSVIRAVSQAAGAQILAVLLGSSVIQDPAGKSFPDDLAYTRVFWFMAGISAAGFILATFVPNRRKASPQPNPA